MVRSVVPHDVGSYSAFYAEPLSEITARLKHGFSFIMTVFHGFSERFRELFQFAAISSVAFGHETVTLLVERPYLSR
jgi:hypothetical protein